MRISLFVLCFSAAACLPAQVVSIPLVPDKLDVNLDGKPFTTFHFGADTALWNAGLAGGAAYGATKAALASFTQAWAAEYSPRGVRVNAVAPGPIYTRPEARELFDSLGAATAMKRAADPAEIAEVVAFLASPRASYMTGAIVAADGGRTAI